MPITLKQAKELDYGDMLHHDSMVNSDGSPLRLKVNGKPKTWKRDLDRIKVPVKHGLYQYGEITNGTIEGNQFTLDISEVSLGDGIEYE